jgi:undecaprenyl-diphosphatase
MIEALQTLDKKLFFLLNGFHNEAMDQFMFIISGKEIWFPLYALLIFGVIYNLKKIGIIFILAAVMAVGASDFVTSGIIKKSVERFRPSRDSAFMDKVHIVNDYRGGKYGFASSHAANSFAIAMFFFMFWRKRFRWIWLLFIWAFLISYSRVYLGVHFPGDILVGGIIGILFGYLFFKGARALIKRKFPDFYAVHFS